MPGSAKPRGPRCCWRRASIQPPRGPAVRYFDWTCNRCKTPYKALRNRGLLPLPAARRGGAVPEAAPGAPRLDPGRGGGLRARPPGPPEAEGVGEVDQGARGGPRPGVARLQRRGRALVLPGAAGRDRPGQDDARDRRVWAGRSHPGPGRHPEPTRILPRGMLWVPAIELGAGAARDPAGRAREAARASHARDGAPGRRPRAGAPRSYSRTTWWKC